MTDYTDLKVPVFTGINDVPVAPTNSKAGNGSHLIATINNLIDRLSVEQIVEIGSSNWNIVTSSITLQTNSKNIITITGNENPSIVIDLPTNVDTGNYVTLIKAHEEVTCQLYVYPQIRGHGLSEIFLEAVHEEVTLIYINPNQGWVMSREGVLSFTPIPQ